MLTTSMIGNKIAEARKKANISQAQLAEHLFISPQAVGKWERGESMPDIITFNRLAGILGVDLNYFSEDFQSGEAGSSPAEPPSAKPKQQGWDMSRGNWIDADFSGLKNLHEKFSSSNMLRCKFNGSDLSGLLLKKNNVESCDFSGSGISNSQVQDSNLGNNIFTECSLKETEFSGTNVYKCDFSGANLAGTRFSRSFVYGCNFTGADFTGMVIKSGGFSGMTLKSGGQEKNTISGAIWKNTSFIDTQVADIVFTGTMEDCSFENCGFTRVTFHDSKLINTFFKNKSLKKIRFIDCQADRMTFEFLKNGKADLTGITMVKA